MKNQSAGAGAGDPGIQDAGGSGAQERKRLRGTTGDGGARPDDGQAAIVNAVGVFLLIRELRAKRACRACDGAPEIVSRLAALVGEVERARGVSEDDPTQDVFASAWRKAGAGLGDPGLWFGYVEYQMARAVAELLDDEPAAAERTVRRLRGGESRRVFERAADVAMTLRAGGVTRLDLSQVAFG